MKNNNELPEQILPVQALDSESLESKPISLARGTAIVSSLTLVSRLLGFARDLLIAKGFGSGAYSDCFFVAFRIPNLLRSFVAEGALSSAFVPIFADSLKHGHASAYNTIRRVSGFIVACSVILLSLGILFAPQIVASFAPGFRDDPHLMALCTELTRCLLPIILCVSLVAMLNGALNTLGNFGAAAWSQIWMNIVLIAGAFVALWQDSETGIRLLAYSALLGAVLQVVVQLPALRTYRLSILPDFVLFHPEIRKLVKLMLPAIVGATVYQLGIFLNTMLASLLAPGSVSWLYYADRLIQFPLGTFSIALGSVLLPALAVSHAAGDSGSFEKKTFAALRYTSFFIIPLSGFVFALAEPLTKLLFERGEFSAHDTTMTAAAVQMYSLGIWSVSSHSLFARTFIARKDTMTNTLVGMGALLVNFIVSLLVIGSFDNTGGMSEIIAGLQRFLVDIFPSGNLGTRGLGLASACGSMFSFLLLAFLARNILKSGWSDYFKSTAKSLIATVALVLTIACIPYTETLNFWSGLSLKIASAAAVWIFICYLLRSSELFEVWRIAERRISRK